MTYIIIKRPHPLDRLWNGLTEGVTDAFDALEAIPDDPEAPGDVDLDAADAAYRIARDRLAEMLALPARNLCDVFSKLDALLDDDGERIKGALKPVLEEFLDLLEAGENAGREYEREQADAPSASREAGRAAQ